MKIVARPDGHWITDTPTGVEEMGPYRSKKEAEQDMRGVERSLKSLEPKK